MRHVGMIAAACVAVVASSASLAAQGSSVEQQGACMTARVSAGVAMPCLDGSAVFFNPGALAVQPSTVGLGVTLIRSGNTFEYHATMSPAPLRIERETESVPVPQAFVNYRLGQRMALGLGVWAPYGLGLKWPVCSVDEPSCDGPNFEGRYTGYDNSLRGLYIQPTVAYQLIPSRLSIGAGVDIVRGSIEVHQRADAPPVGLSGVDVADVTLEGDSWGVTGNIGAHAQITPRLALGLRYLHSVTLDIDGDATIEQVLTGTPADALLAPRFAEGAELASQGVKTQIELPAQFVVGLAVRATDQLVLLADYMWTGWSAFDQFDLDFANQPARVDRQLVLDYDDASTYKFAVEYAATEQLALRGGFRYNTAATPRGTPLLPEGERNYFSLGAGYRLTNTLTADAGWQYIKQVEREGTVRPGGPMAGIFTASGQVFGLTLSWRFGPVPQPAQP